MSQARTFAKQDWPTFPYVLVAGRTIIRSRGVESKKWSSREEGSRVRTIHRERHLIERIGWLRAAVLGANDGIISTASLILGVASAASAENGAILAGVAGLVAGAM